MGLYLDSDGVGVGEAVLRMSLCQGFYGIVSLRGTWLLMELNTGENRHISQYCMSIQLSHQTR